MARIATALLLFLGFALCPLGAIAAEKGKAKPGAGKADKADKSAAAGGDKSAGASGEETRAEESKPAPAPGRTPKARVYTFGGLDVEGKLKTPQLLYFRGRVKQELDTSTAQKRSFLEELGKSADEKGL